MGIQRIENSKEQTNNNPTIGDNAKTTTVNVATLSHLIISIPRD